MKLILGCPTLRRYDLLGGMIRSAAAGARAPDRYYVIDNGGELFANGKPDWLPLDEVTVVLSTGEVVRRPAAVSIDVPGENLGCARSWNTMAKTLLFNDDTALLLTGDDVKFAPDTIAAMMSEMEKTKADFLTVEPGGFSCFMVRRTVFEKIGYFDEQFWPAYFEDNDFYRRMKLCPQGVVMAHVETAKYEHVNRGSQTLASFTPQERLQHNDRFKTNRARYVAKWGGLPHEETFDEPYNGLEPSS